ncbi:MAG: hypothetical protein VX733_13735 [Candidatus Latescibacterota bacterium]|nr:hypothetical protein [Candidatus Latescibacterota bacterium]
MEAWVFCCNDSPLEHWTEGYKERFDAWEAGGIRGLVVGRMLFRQPDGSQIRAYAPDLQVYSAHGEDPPEIQSRDETKERQLQAMLDDAASRGWELMIFGFGGSVAQLEDQLNAFPQISGFIIDGPGENHYELEFHHGGELLEIRSGEEARFEAIGVDVERMQRGIDHMRESLSKLTPERVRYHAAGGMLGAMLLFDVNEEALYWLRSRQQASLNEWKRARELADAADRPVRLGGIPRAVSFSSLTGQNYHLMAPYFDLIFPKHYFWHRGMDGMYGTISRWVKRLRRWNSGLSEADSFDVVKALFGIELPEVRSLVDMEMGFPNEFFSQLVYGESRRALDAIGDADKVIAWVSTGRCPHGGDQMTARDLQGILSASQQAGIKRFLYHPEPDIGAAEWNVITRMCGTPWDEDPKGYWPKGTPLPDTWNGGRVAPDVP